MGRSQPGCRQDTEGEVVRGGAHRRRWFGWSLKGGEDSGSGQRAGDQSEQRRRRPRWGLSQPRACYGNFCFQEWLPEEFVGRISQLDTQSPVTKINGERPTPLWSRLFDVVRVSRVQVWGRLADIIISTPTSSLPPSLKVKHLFILFLPSLTRGDGSGRTLGAEDTGLWALTPPPHWSLSGRQQAARLPGSPQLSRGPAAAPSPVLHPPEL